LSPCKRRATAVGLPASQSDLARVVARLGARPRRERIDDVDPGTARGQAPIFNILLVMYTDPARPRLYAFSPVATMTEGVTLRRGEGERVWAETWSAGSTVRVVGAGGAEVLMKDVSDMVERFVEYSKVKGRVDG